MASSSDTAATVEKAAQDLQKGVLKDCIAALRQYHIPFWIFVHLRSIALRKEGRCSDWATVNCARAAKDTINIDNALRLQYRIEPNLRTYNELLISRDHSPGVQSVSFSFGDTAERADIHFTDDEINGATQRLTQRLTFSLISSRNGSIVKEESRKLLSDLRLSLGLDEAVRSSFNLSYIQPNNPLRALPEEVRYALQVLMLWSNTLSWKYLETFHSRTRFDALSGLVITVASRTQRLNKTAVSAIAQILQQRDGELDQLVSRKTELLPRFEKASGIPTNLNTRLSIRTPRDERLWDGLYVFHVIEHIRKELFAATFEGVPESYAFVLGHPGFISRPQELEISRSISLQSIREHRELCEGALDTLNVIDILGQPQKEPDRLSLYPVALPVWAKNWEDAEQAFSASLEALSFVHREVVVVGMMCRNVIMVYKGGELICVFNGAWHEILPWQAIATKKLGIPENLADQPRAGEIFRLLTRVAYGPLPRSIIVGYAKNKSAFDRFHSKGEIQPFSRDFTKWPTVELEASLEPTLMRATKTDGAILTYTDADGRLYLISRARVVSKVTRSSSSGAASGTGDATAQAIASRGSGIVSVKVSRDGGMKIRWDGKGPVKVAVPMERS